MKPRLVISLLLILPFVSRGGAEPPTDTKLIEITQNRIAALYRYHDHKAPPPSVGSNPFRPEDSTASSPELPRDDGQVKISPADRDAALLRQAVNKIRISGVINMGDQLQIVANQLIYKEGARILVRLEHENVLVRVMKITPKIVTLGLGEAELDVRI